MKTRKRVRPKVRSFRIENKTWDYILFVRIGGTAAAAAAWASRHLESRCPVDPAVDFDGLTFLREGECSNAIWFARSPGAGLVAHEAFHSIVHVLRLKGNWPLIEENEESFAYLLDWTVREIGQRVW